MIPKAFTIRKSNGEVIKTTLTEELLDPFINNVRFLDRNPDHIQYFLSYPKHPQAEGFCSLVPCDGKIVSGVIVIDSVNNKILDGQNYASLGELSGSILLGSLEGKKEGIEKMLGEDFSLPRRFQEFIDRNKVVRVYDSHTRKEFDTRGLTFDNIFRVLSKKGLYMPSTSVHLDMSPFEVKKYVAGNAYYGAIACRDMRDMIKELGFSLSSEEESVWDNAISELKSEAERE